MVNTLLKCRERHVWIEDVQVLEEELENYMERKEKAKNAFELRYQVKIQFDSI